MIKFLAQVFFICTVNTYDLKGSSFKNGKFFELLIDRCEVMHETPKFMELHIQVKKINKTRGLIGYLTYHEPIGNNFIVGIKLLKKQGGEYRYMPYAVAPGPFCDVLSKDEFLYPEIARQSDLPEDLANNCPILPGNYSFHGVKSNLNNIPTVALQTGEYAGEITYQFNGQEVAVYRLYGYVNNV